MYADERVDAQDEPSEERAGRVEDSRSDMRENVGRWGYGSGNWDGSGSGGTLGGRANECVGDTSKWKKDSPSETDRVRGFCKDEWLDWDDSMRVAGDGEESSRLDVAAAIIVLEFRDPISLPPAADGVGGRERNRVEMG